MLFDFETLVKSIAKTIKPFFPDTAFYIDPNQQNTIPPCFFIQIRHAKIKNAISEMFLRQIDLDLVYQLDYNLPNLQREYQKIADKLDECINMIEYSESDRKTYIHAENRDSTIRPDELHYKFSVNVWCRREPIGDSMEVMSYAERVEEIQH